MKVNKNSIITIIVSFVVVAGVSYYSFERGRASANADCQVPAQTIADSIIKNEVQTAASMLDAISAEQKKGTITAKEAKTLAANLLRAVRYGDDKNGYFWADTTDGVNVVLYGNKDVEGKNRLEDKVNGVYYIKDIIAKAQQGGGFTDYWYPKMGQKEALAKRAYSAEVKPFGWVIGTGYYVDDLK